MTKICSICGLEKPLTTFKKGGASRPGYISPYCRNCGPIKPRGPRLPVPEGQKRCSICREVKPLDSFSYKRHPDDPEHRSSQCRVCRGRLRSIKWHADKAADPEGFATKQKTKRARHTSYNSAYGRTHRPQINHNKRRRYREAPELKQVVDAKYRAVVRGASRVENVKIAVLITRDKGICGLCQKPVAKRDATIDHIIPVSKGGEHSYRNTQLAHKSCNSRKGNRVLYPEQLRLIS
jgi:5-methylcytosine-specific restriction endonuclease McrA